MLMKSSVCEQTVTPKGVSLPLCDPCFSHLPVPPPFPDKPWDTFWHWKWVCIFLKYTKFLKFTVARFDYDSVLNCIKVINNNQWFFCFFKTTVASTFLASMWKGRVNKEFCASDSQTIVSRPATSAPPGKALEIEILRLYPKPIKSETLGVGPTFCFNERSRWC